LLAFSEQPSTNIEFVRKKLREEGLEESRLMISRTSQSRHEILAMLTVVDVYLDSFWYNGCTTLTDVIFMGIPAVSLLGKTFRSRMGASLLRSAGFDELVGRNVSHYIDIAYELATNAEKRNAIKEKILATRESMPLFDTKKYAAKFDLVLKQLFFYKQHDIQLPRILWA
jgi:predicted O-linked N-acetylglucosamine transferase (SPINDLY family)